MLTDLIVKIMNSSPKVAKTSSECSEALVSSSLRTHFGTVKKKDGSVYGVFMWQAATKFP